MYCSYGIDFKYCNGMSLGIELESGFGIRERNMRWEGLVSYRDF